MENKTPSQNIQDVYLNTVRREKAPVTVFLISGVKLIGKIKGFDKYSVILEANNQEQLIFKHAISTVTTAKVVSAPPPPPPIPRRRDCNDRTNADGCLTFGRSSIASDLNASASYDGKRNIGRYTLSG